MFNIEKEKRVLKNNLLKYFGTDIFWMIVDAAYNKESSSEWMQEVKLILADLNVEASTNNNTNIPCERALDYIKARLKHKYSTYSYKTQLYMTHHMHNKTT